MTALAGAQPLDRGPSKVAMVGEDPVKRTVLHE